MRGRWDIVVAGVIIALCAFAVVKQLEHDPIGPVPIEAIALGDKLDPTLTLEYINDPPAEIAIGRWFGAKATVLMTWSVPCPCIEQLEHRLRMLYTRLGPREGVSWIAVAGEPLDTPETVRAKMGKLRSFYKLVLDPQQLVCQRLGFREAAQVAVLDAAGRLRYRGTVDADYENGTADLLEAALVAVVAGRPVPEPETEWVYGCTFGDPASCEEYERP